MSLKCYVVREHIGILFWGEDNKIFEESKELHVSKSEESWDVDLLKCFKNTIQIIFFL